MDLTRYRECVQHVTWGKRVNSALYVYCATGWSLGYELDALVHNLRQRFGAAIDCNILKFRFEEPKISFLSYPEFLEQPHPSLKLAITIDLVTGRGRVADYSENPNPPILHRKEAFLPQGHPSQDLFAQLTSAEQEAGLFEHTATIGFKLNWSGSLPKRVWLSKGIGYSRPNRGKRNAFAKRPSRLAAIRPRFGATTCPSRSNARWSIGLSTPKRLSSITDAVWVLTSQPLKPSATKRKAGTLFTSRKPPNNPAMW